MNQLNTLATHSAHQGENLPILGPLVPRRGNRITRALGKAILSLFNWSIVGEIPDAPKILIIGGPHTSNWDYVLTIVTMMALGGDLHYVVKHSLFNHPFGGFFRWLGGVSVNRSSTRGFVDQMVDEFERRKRFALAIMPEGTRRKVSDWRSGFYFIALKAQIPVSLVAFDYRFKKMRFNLGLNPGGDYTADLIILQAFYAQIQGKHPN